MQPGVNAEFKIKTLNGKIYSDFPMLMGAANQVKSSEDGMKRIWRTDRFSNMRIGYLIGARGGVLHGGRFVRRGVVEPRRGLSAARGSGS